MPAALNVRDQGPVRIFSIAHPARKNAVDAAVLARIAAETARATADGVRASVLMGEGADFCSGYDLNAVEAWDPLDLAAELPDAPLGRACAALEAAGPPVLAAGEGVAFGAGCELACACDFRVASSKARFSIPPARLGIVYSAEGAARILRLVGLQAARSLFLRAQQIPAADAERMGLIDQLADEPLVAALKLAADLAALAPRSIAGMKRTLNAVSRTALDDGTRAELDHLRREAFASADAKEGRAAFLERRPPRWTGR